MGVIYDYRVTDNSDFLTDGKEMFRSSENYTLELELRHLNKSEVDEIMKYLESKMIK